MKRWILTFGILLALPMFGFAETYWGGELPSIDNTRVKADVTINGDIYDFSYIIINMANNSGYIWRFRVDVRQPQAGADVNGEGLVSGPGFLKQTSALILSEPTTPKMIPFGLFSPPNWHSSVDVLGQVGWGSNDAKYRILPDQSLDGFHITSRGLPGLRDFTIEPKLIPPSEEGDVTNDQIQEVEDKVAFKGQTLGPTAPPANFVALDFVNYIIDLKHQAGTLGWITNPGVPDSLDVKLDQVKKHIQAGNTKPAVNVLNAFLNELDAQGCPKYEGCPPGKHLLPEAWALLKFNAEYLLGKL